MTTHINVSGFVSKSEQSWVSNGLWWIHKTNKIHSHIITIIIKKTKQRWQQPKECNKKKTVAFFGSHFFSLIFFILYFFVVPRFSFGVWLLGLGDSHDVSISFWNFPPTFHSIDKEWKSEWACRTTEEIEKQNECQRKREKRCGMMTQVCWFSFEFFTFKQSTFHLFAVFPPDLHS